MSFFFNGSILLNSLDEAPVDGFVMEEACVYRLVIVVRRSLILWYIDGVECGHYNGRDDRFMITKDNCVTLLPGKQNKTEVIIANVFVIDRPLDMFAVVKLGGGNTPLNTNIHYE